MTAANAVARDERIAELAENYQAEGYEVVVAPEASTIPFDLGGHRMDLLARKNAQGVLVQVKSTADRLSFEALQTVAAEVRRHPGWRFVLVTPQDIAGDDLPGEDGDAPSWDEIEMRKGRALRLLDAGEPEAAYLGLWIAFERLMRLQAERIALPAARSAASNTIRQLYSLGEISAEQFDLALECQKVRNRVVHGIASPELNERVERLSELLNGLLETWKAETVSI